MNVKPGFAPRTDAPATAAAPDAAPPAAADGPATAPDIEGMRVGVVKAASGWHRSIPLFAGPETGPTSGYTTLDDAFAGAARVAKDDAQVDAQVVVHAGTGDDERYFTYELEQPEWVRRFLRDDVRSEAPTDMRADTGDPRRVSFVTYSDYGTFTDDPTGTFLPNTKLEGYDGIVSAKQALVDGKLEDVTPAPEHDTSADPEAAAPSRAPASPTTDTPTLVGPQASIQDDQNTGVSAARRIINDFMAELNRFTAHGH
jgi:hypothetical protein